MNKLDSRNDRDCFSLADMLYFIIWFGVISGLAEVVLPQMNKLRGGRAVFLRSHTIWMSPLANVVVIGIVGLIIFSLLLCLSRPKAVRISFILLASVVFLNILVLNFEFLSRINFVAKLILAIGLSIVLYRFITWWRIDFERLVRRTTLGLVLLVLISAVIISGHRYFKERNIITALPDPPESVPNVLLIVLDTVRSESMSLYGYERSTTPYLKDLAREGTVFQNAIATSSWTLPTHASLFTGRFAYQTSADWNSPLDTKYPTLAEVLGSHGYVTGGFVANTAFCNIEHGLARGFCRYEDHVPSTGEFARSSALVRFAVGRCCGENWLRRLIGYYEWLDRKPAPRITNDFLNWIDRIPNGRPFFAFLNYFDAHQPFLPPKDFARKFGRIDHLGMFLNQYGHKPSLSSNLTAEEIESVRNAYDGAIAYLDEDLNRLFGELRKRDILDRTLVIIVSDHGEEFGEHGTIGHGRDLHIQSIRVPLILRFPNVVPTAITVQESVTLRDLPSTVIDLLGLPDDGLFPGRSLKSFWIESKSQEMEKNEPILSELTHAPWMKEMPISKGDMKSIIIDNIHYILNGDGSEEVYDLRDDPVELSDLIETSHGKEAAEKARIVLKQLIR